MIEQLLAPELVPASQLSAVSGARVFFAGFALLTVIGAVMTITQRNMVAAVMWLVATFFGVAAIFAMLDAHFLAALQVLVYAGAIMVLFIFVVMVLNRDEIEPVSDRGLVVKGIVSLAMLGGFVLLTSKYLREFAPSTFPTAKEGLGSVAEVGMVLFTDYLFAFEAISVLLLIAVVAAVVVAKTPKHEHPGDVQSRHQHEDAAEAAHHHDTTHGSAVHAFHAAHASHAPQGDK